MSDRQSWHPVTSPPLPLNAVACWTSDGGGRRDTLESRTGGRRAVREARDAFGSRICLFMIDGVKLIKEAQSPSTVCVVRTRELTVAWKGLYIHFSPGNAGMSQFHYYMLSIKGSTCLKSILCIFIQFLHASLVFLVHFYFSSICLLHDRSIDRLID